MGRQLKGMAKAKRVFTVDDDEYDDGTTAAVHSDVDYSDDDVHEPQAASSLRIRASKFDDTDPTYGGKVVKRADLRDDDEDEDEMEREMQEEWSEGEPFASSGDENDEGSDAEEQDDDDDGENVEVDDENEDDNDDEDDDEGEEGSESGDEADDDVDDVIRNLENEDKAVLMKGTDENQQQRAKHVYHQKLIYERCLELQISIKQILTAVHELDASTPDEEKEPLIQSVKQSMAMLHAMQQQLYSHTDFAPSRSSKRTFDDMNAWESIQEESEAALEVYKPILNKHSVQADTQGKKFKAVNQEILVQVDGILEDAHRIRRKAHPVKESTDATDGEEDELDELLYDDKDFYHQILKEYIETGSSVTEGAAAQLKLKRKTKKVNRKASKGRVIKYTVMPKLQHFMFPNPSATRSDMDVDELFRSLFRSSAVSN